MLVNNMGTTDEISVNFLTVKGASLDYTCGVISSAKAVVFNADGLRLIETQELSTVDSRYQIIGSFLYGIFTGNIS